MLLARNFLATVAILHTCCNMVLQQPHEKKFGGVDVLVVGMAYLYNDDNATSWKNKVFDCLVKIFDFGTEDNQTRFAFACGGDYGHSSELYYTGFAIFGKPKTPHPKTYATLNCRNGTGGRKLQGVLAVGAPKINDVRPNASLVTIECDECPKDFAQKIRLERHKKSAHQGLRYRCFECGDILKQPAYLQNHYKLYHCIQTYCQHCNNTFTTVEGILAPGHIDSCSKIKAVIPEPAQQEGAGNSLEQLQNKPLIIESDPDAITNEIKDELPTPFRPIYEEYWNIIKTSANKTDLMDHVYNFRIHNPEQIPYNEMLQDIYAQEPSSFRINAALGYILQNTDGEQRYFYPEENNYQMLDRPMLISSPEDIDNFIAELQNINIEDKFSRPNTQWTSLAIPNITFFVTPILDFIAGCKNVTLPRMVTHQQNNILTMQWDKNRNPYNDNLCFFRCLSYCLAEDTKVDFVHSLFQQYCLKKGLITSAANFNGVPLTDIEDGTGQKFLENLFQVNIQLFNLTNNNTATCWKHVYPKRFDKTLNLDICFPTPGRVHFSYIKNLDHYAKRYKCSGCSRMFKGRRDLKQHIKGRKHGQSSCKLGKTEHKFVGGVYKNKETLFEEMEEADISVPMDLRNCEYLAVYDFEALLLKRDIQTGPKLNFIASHQPVSWAVHTNVPGFESPCFYSHENPDKLVKEFINYLTIISEQQDQILSQCYRPIFEKLFEKIEQCQMCVAELKENGKDYRREKGYKNRLENLKRHLETYCSQLTIIGFNSKKYDLNLIKRQLYPELVAKVRNKPQKDILDIVEEEIGESTLSGSEEEEEEEINDVTDELQEMDVDEDETDGEDLTEENDETDLKVPLSWPKAIVNNNSYMCLTTTNFRFLDASNYLAAGSSLDGLLKMYQTELQKLKFPYEWLDTFEKLNATSLPPIEAFHSSLKNEQCTNNEYQNCQQLWIDNNMETMFDYLKLYNIRDVEPFLIALLKMRDDKWKQFYIDIFRDVVSLPGFTLRYIFNNTKVAFALFREKDKELYYEMKKAMIGGLSLVMTRLAIAGETQIRNNPNHIVGSIVGYDAASLYLGSQGGSMPCGFYDYWVPDDDGYFIKKISSKKLEVEWLEQLEYLTKRTIRHQGNNSQKRIGIKQLPVDGFCADNNTVYEFYGCYYHCHDCTFGLRNTALTPDQRQAKIQWDIEKEAYIRSLGYNLITIQECIYRKQRRQLLYLRQQLEPTAFRKYYSTYKVSTEAMVDSIISGEVFGFAKIDLFTPEELKENYSDYPPISKTLAFKHAKIGREHIGDHMRAYCNQTNQLVKPRDNLTSSYSAKGELMFTPMIRFHVQHGLVIEKIHYVVQYNEAKPFEWFRDKVTEMRLKGDAIDIVRDVNGEIIRDPFGNPVTSQAEKSEACSLAADTYKLLGNTGYGKSITNKEKHLETRFCDFAKAAECNRSPYIKRIITQDCYEVQMFKKSITMDLPIVIGLATYSNSKVRMLSFAYDCLLKYCDKSKYMWIETDTDSCYIATESKSGDIREIVRPEMLSEFNQDYNNWFVDPSIPYTSRKSGLFKVEAHGTKMAALCSNTYVLVDDNSGKSKKSHKGLSQRTNNVQFEAYHNVLLTQQQSGGENRGFRLRNGQMWTYHQTKLGLPYLYIKREVLADGINTKPLDI